MARLRTFQGYTQLGNKRIPPLPQYLILTDRDDGTEWTLTHDETGEWVGITDDPPVLVPGALEFQDVVRYGPNEGPFVNGNKNLRLLVRGGYLGFEEVLPANPIHNSARILTRRRVERRILEIILPTAYPTTPQVTLAYLTNMDFP